MEQWWNTIEPNLEHYGMITKHDGTKLEQDGTMMRHNRTKFEHYGTIMKHDGTKLEQDGKKKIIIIMNHKWNSME